MYEKRPTRWRGRPAHAAPDVFLPVLDALGRRRREGRRRPAGVRRAAGARGTQAVEDRIFDVLFDVFGHRKHHATTLPAVKPTVAEFLAHPGGADLPAARLRPGLPGLRATTTSSTAPRRCPSSRRCTAGRWCCTTSTRGTARRSSWPRSASSPTTTTWSSFAPARPATCAASCAGWRRAGARPAPAPPREPAAGRRPFPALDVRRALHASCPGSRRSPPSTATRSAPTTT